MRTAKGLIYFGKKGKKLRQYVSVLDDDKLYYIITVDGREKRRGGSLERDKVLLLLKKF